VNLEVKPCAYLEAYFQKYDEPVKLVAFTDYVYSQRGEILFGERAFALFLVALTAHVEQLTIVGRLNREPRTFHYPIPASVRFVGLPHYSSLTKPFSVALSLVRSLQRFWRALDDADRVWLLGPYPHAVAFAVIALMRHKPLILGVRQDFPAYVRSRRPTRRWMHRAADLLELSWRLLARRAPVVVVGPELERHYRHAPAVLQIAVSLVTADDVAEGERAAGRSYDGDLYVLSVGRIDSEKNPLLLADVLAQLREDDPRWRLVVCGEGPLAEPLQARLRELGLDEHAEIRGYVPIDGGLLDLYRSSHAFLHVSLTEGVPQVLIEAFASGVPVVATAVGGVAEAAGEAALLIPPRDASAATQALTQIAVGAELRVGLIDRGLALARRHTLESETARVAAFISSPNGAGPTGA
jgi:glycosyltransferase involved in cell wall biosynthesis